jgi:hypothetical protein
MAALKQAIAVEETQSGLALKPAFFDMETGRIYLSRYADGREAPIHIVDGLPQQIMDRVNINIVSGFVLNNRFLTREQAMRLLNLSQNVTSAGETRRK